MYNSFFLGDLITNKKFYQITLENVEKMEDQEKKMNLLEELKNFETTLNEMYKE